MLASFGKPPAVYDGPYPSKEEVLKVMSDAAPTPPDEFLRGSLVISGNRTNLQEAVVEKILGDLGHTKYDLGDEFVPRSVMGDTLVQRIVQAAIYKGRCLIVRVRTKDKVPQDDLQFREMTDQDGCILFDSRTMRAFARYTFEGHAPRFARLLVD